VKPIHVAMLVIWALVLIAAHELYRGASVITHAVAFVDDTTSVSGRYGATQATPAAPRVDLYGNEIHQAIGDYRVDPRGELYELHAPNTAVLRLGPPGT
jgi:hypothetical protein